MKNVVLIVVLMSLIVITSCKKNTSANQGGTWSFKSSSYTSTAFSESFGSVTVANQPTAYSNNYTTLTVNFYNGRPTTNSSYYTGTYQVVGGTTLDSTNQVYITFTINGTSDTLYHTTGGNGKETVQVVLSNGNISITGSGIEMANTNDVADSSILNFNIVQP